MRVVTHNLITHCVGCISVSHVTDLPTPVLRDNTLLVAHVERLVAHMVVKATVWKRGVGHAVAPPGRFNPSSFHQRCIDSTGPQFLASKTTWTLVRVGQSKESSSIATLTIRVTKQKINRLVGAKEDSPERWISLEHNDVE